MAFRLYLDITHVALPLSHRTWVVRALIVRDSLVTKEFSRGEGTLGYYCCSAV